jgi:hypothetical protein
MLILWFVRRLNTRAHAGRGPRLSSYLAIQHNYEVDRMPGVFVAGAAAHFLDFRKAAGGNIRGYRYTG